MLSLAPPGETALHRHVSNLKSAAPILEWGASAMLACHERARASPDRIAPPWTPPYCIAPPRTPPHSIARTAPPGPRLPPPHTRQCYWSAHWDSARGWLPGDMVTQHADALTECSPKLPCWPGRGQRHLHPLHGQHRLCWRCQRPVRRLRNRHHPQHKQDRLRCWSVTGWVGQASGQLAVQD